MNLSDLNPNPARIVAVTIDMSPHQCNPTPSVSFSQRNSTLSPSRSPYFAHVNSNQPQLFAFAPAIYLTRHDF